MAEPSPNHALQIADTEGDTKPVLVNGLAEHEQGTDVIMEDSGAVNELLSHATPAPAPQPSFQPTVTTQPPTPTPPPNPAPISAPALPTATPASSRNSPHPTQQAPTQPMPHGSPTRVYLNQHVTPHLLEAMKHLATTEPDKPLKWLSEFFGDEECGD